uniref:F-box domain-containing protein n=1 Tax=Bionectria ochroleuca TaxID=29856 RepID=A0A8H7MZF0_BIOOC
MGSWDCYCMVCCGPMTYVRIRGHENYVKDPNAGPRTVREEDDEAEENHDQREEEEEEEEEEEDDGWLYDPKVIQPADIDWTENCRVLGINAYCTRLSKAFISGQGCYDDLGVMTCDQGDDPNCEDVEVEAMPCYFDYNDNEDPVFPFHMDCFKLLSRYLTGSDDIGLINKDVMYGVVCSLADSTCLNLDYAFPGTDFRPTPEQAWYSIAGEELFVVSPLRMAPLSTTEIEKLQLGTGIASLDQALGNKVKSDPFSKLPREITDQIFSALDDTSLMDLFKASWALHSAHHNNHDFWMRRIKDEMEWFFELHEVLQSPGFLDGVSSMKAVYLWANLKSKPRLGFKGKYMGVANRRRIWFACGQIAESYRAKIAVSAGDVDESIEDNAASPYTSIVSWPTASSDQLFAHSFWISSWDALYSSKTLDTFWDSEGYLTGIAVTINGQKRLFGFDNKEHDLQQRTLEFQRHEWIAEMILHIPPIDPLAPSASHTYPKAPGTFTAPKGISIRTSTGTTLSVGETAVGHCQRPLLAPSGQTVVGMAGNVGIVQGKPRIIRAGLLLCPRSLSTDSLLSEPEIPNPPLAETFLWTQSAFNVLGRPLWENDQLRLRIFEGGLATQPGGYFHEDIVPHDAFLWAQDRSQLQALKKITVYSVQTGTRQTGGLIKKTEITKAVGNMRADFDDASGLDPVFARSAEVNGTPIPDDMIETFEIDGPGGERIIELAGRMGLYLDAFKLRTNRGREFLWKSQSDVGDGWRFLTVPDGHEAIAGLILAWSDPFGYDPAGKTFDLRTHSRLDYLGIVTTECEE